VWESSSSILPAAMACNCDACLMVFGCIAHHVAFFHAVEFDKLFFVLQHLAEFSFVPWHLAMLFLMLGHLATLSS